MCYNVSRKLKGKNMVCGRLEIDILNSIWYMSDIDEDRDISIQDVVDYLSSSGLERAYTTIKTVMDRLTAKSILVRYKVGKKFFYRAAVDREEMILDSVKSLSEQFFGGSYVEMLRFIEHNCCENLV